MLTIATLGAGSERYYLRSSFDAMDEYYVRGEERGRWTGRGAETLGLSGEVTARDLSAVLDGRSPADAGSLIARGPGKRRAGFDFTFSAPKGVSLIGLLGDADTSRQVMAGHESAVAQALGYLERNAAFVRRGHGGARFEPAQGLVGAAFVHVTSRAGDPQLHTHVLLANLAQGPEGAWSAPDSRALYRHSRTAGFLYQAALRAELTERLGISWRPVHRGMAEPAGIPDAVLGHFSRRRTEIEAAMHEAGTSSAEAAQVAAYKTRAPKDHSVERSVLVGSWRVRADQLGLGREALRSLAPGGHDPGIAPARELAARLLGDSGLTLHESTFGHQEVLRGLSDAAPEGASVAGLERMAAHVLADQRAVAVGTGERGQRWTTAELLATERELVSSALLARGDGRAVVETAALSATLGERPGLADEQVSALRRLLRAGEGLAVLVGPAGTGKTFVLEAARSAWEATGHRVIGTALAGRTAAALGEAAGVPSFTLARLLSDDERGIALPRGGVVLVDEAAMVGTRALSKLWAAAQRSGAKLVLVGDNRQVPEIEAGGAFGALAKALEAPELTENRRQGEAWERAALAELRSGTPAKAVEAYASHGRVVLVETAVEARRAMVGQWWAARAGGAYAVMFAVTRSDVEALNRLARELARDAGQLGASELVSGGRAFAVGDDVLTLRPDRHLGVLNGTAATVTALDLDAGTLTIAIKKGEPIVVPPSYLEAGYLGWGYAMTLHKGQGATVDRAFLLGGEGLYREAGYTGLSRGRSSNDVYLVAGGSFAEEDHDRRAPQRDPMAALTSSLNRSRVQHLALEAGHDPAAPLGTELDPIGREGTGRGTRAVMAPARRELELQAPEVGAWESLRRRLAARREANVTLQIERGMGQDVGL